MNIIRMLMVKKNSRLILIFNVIYLLRSMVNVRGISVRALSMSLTTYHDKTYYVKHAGNLCK